MDENQSTSSTPSNGGGGSKNLVVMAIVAVVVIALLIGGGYYFLYMSKPQDDAMMVEEQTPTPEAMEENSEPQSGNYQDGTYTATGTYSYHSGTESVEVTVTLEGGVITEAEVVSQAQAAVSKTMQADFIANFEPEVVGRNIDEVEVGKVSGSSLTGIGFNAALEDIKEQAQG